MKKILVLVIIAIGMVLSANAQESSFGVRASFNLSQINYNNKGVLDMPISDPINKIGFNVGAIYDWGISKHFYIQPGLYFTTRGAVEKEDMGVISSMSYNLNYLQIPILASFRINIADNMQVQINAGPYFSYGVGGKIKAKMEEDGLDVGVNRDSFSKEIFKRFDAGLSFGAGISVSKFYIGVSYELGLMNILQIEEYGDDRAKLRNSNIAISVGYNF